MKNKERHRRMTDETFSKSFAEGTLPPMWFTHEAHIRLAWIYIHNFQVDKACDLLCEHIRRFAEKHGVTDSFNMTVTVAATKAVHHFIQRSNYANFPDFIEAFPQLKDAMKELLNQHYSWDIYTSEDAKKAFIEPDLAPFD